MDRDLLPHLPIIVAVARRAGFAAAAAELGMSPSAVSHSVRLVEERVGTPLFARTTRSVSLTEAGEDFIATIAPALADIEERIERTRSSRGRPAGVLRINASRVAIRMVLTDIVAEMAERHPDVTVELFADEALTDIVAEGFDAGVRLGEMVDQDMTIVRLTPPFKAILVAAPAYLDRYGTPHSIAELGAHGLIGFRLMRSRSIYRWELLDGGEPVSLTTKGPLILNDALLARDMALAGVGIGYLFAPLVAADIAAGRLTQLLPETAIEEPGFFLYFPKRAALAPKLRAFITVAREIFSRAR